MMNIRDMILEKTRQGLDVFHHYINTPFAPKRRFKNPLYTDAERLLPAQGLRLYRVLRRLFLVCCLVEWLGHQTGLYEGPSENQ